MDTGQEFTNLEINNIRNMGTALTVNKNTFLFFGSKNDK